MHTPAHRIHEIRITAGSDAGHHRAAERTDLLRLGAIMAPDFIESQYDDPAFPIERCAIYDAGSRAFWVCEYAEDVRNYWKQVLDLAEQGMDYDTYLHQRFPELDASRFHSPSLREIAIRQINLMS